MATSRAIKKPKRDDTQLSNWQSMPERAPSVERVDKPTVARIVAMVGLFLTVLGALAMYAPVWQRSAAISPGMGFFFFSAGIALLLYHAFVEHDLQFRRLYGFIGLALAIGGVVLRLMAFKVGYMSWFLYYGLPALTIGLVVLIAVIRNETEIPFRTLMVNFLGIEGAIMIAFSAWRGMVDTGFLPGEGVALLILGLCYVGAYIGQETHGERAYYAALGLGAAGAVGFIVGTLRSLWPESNFLVPGGLIIIGMSIVYMAVSVCICSDLPIVVLARRDLAAYFYSPIGYLVLIGITLYAGLRFLFFALRITQPGEQTFEPIIGEYIFDIWPVFAQMFIVPVLTMRLLSEEKRTGTLEVLMTAPVNEVSVVGGKFLASWIFYMLTWLPWWIFLVSLRYVGGEQFDYLPVLSFMAASATVSAGLLSMGLFFSSMTGNQIIAAVLTFVGVMMHLVLYFLSFQPVINGMPAVHEMVRYVNFFDLWQNALGGIIAPRLLVFHISVAIFFLFATIKMLESRKWK
jgi:ABC-2 type transport system permease protein